MALALELSAGRIVARPSPRLVTGAIVAGAVTVDCANASAVIVSLALTANVTSVVYQNLPTVCLVRWRIAQSGGPWTFPASAHPAGTVVDGDEHIYPDATLTRLWWETFDGGVSAILEYNAPAGGSAGDAYAASHEADATAHPASSIVNTPAGNIAATTVQAAINELDSEKAATGHAHAGFYEPAGAVSAHVAAGDPHPQYALESALGGAAALNVGTTAGTVAAGDDSRLSNSRTPTAHASTHQSGGADSIKLDDLATPDDNTDLDATTLRHGLLPKLGGGTTNYLRADGTWAQPAGGGGGGAESGLVIAEATSLGGAMSCYFVEASTLG